MRDDQARLEDILRAIASIARYANRGRLAFDRDELVQSWMIYHLTLIGEAAARLSSALREHHPEVPWPRVIGMRNVLVHGYFATDLEEVWVTVDRRVPTLQRQIEEILREETSDGPPSVSERMRTYQLAATNSGRSQSPHRLVGASHAVKTTSLGRLGLPVAVHMFEQCLVDPRLVVATPSLSFAQTNGDLRLSGVGLDDRATLGPREVNVPISFRSGPLHSVSWGGSASGLRC